MRFLTTLSNVLRNLINRWHGNETIFLLGKVHDVEHEKALVDVAWYLDQCKFPCTFSIVGEFARIDCEPDGKWPLCGQPFPEYAAEIIIHRLSRALFYVRNKDDET